jgi:soluble lytic murein transglycosylase
MLLAAFCSSASAATRTTLETQRQIFRDIYPAVEKGNWAPAAENEAALKNYVLWPDLRATYLRTRLKEQDQKPITEFLSRYTALKPARELRYRLALQLAAQDRHDEFLTIYEEFYRNLGIASLDCLALTAKIASGQTESIATMARPLWLIGKSQVSECDPVFAYLRTNGQLDADLHQQRYALAISARNFSLARYLGRSIGDEYIEEATRWLSAQNRPEGFVQEDAAGPDVTTHKQQLIYALRTMAFRDPLLARQYWLTLRGSAQFNQDQHIDIDRHIALWAARLNIPDAKSLLKNLPPAAVDSEVMRWRIRVALRQHTWADVPALIRDLDADEGEECQYWKAVALQQTGQGEESTALFKALATQRSYYGFLAADQLNQDYSFTQASIESNADIIRKLSSNAALIRARELFYVGLEGRGRSEWDAAVSTLDDTQKTQAAVLAHRWGWHSRAIATVAMSGEYDDLELRYPLPHRESFELFSSDASIRQSWAYGIARSESLFMRDIRSGAGAIGLMQLLPETGRRTAREIGHPYNGLDTLTNPSSNIRLGTFYLGKMNRRFDKHTALATAAYNAGPLRVEEWLPETGAVDARVWIENIPYNETRKYVRRVLMSDAIFHWRLTGKVRRISSHLVDIRAGDQPPQLASRLQRKPRQ